MELITLAHDGPIPNDSFLDPLDHYLLRYSNNIPELVKQLQIVIPKRQDMDTYVKKSLMYYWPMFVEKTPVDINIVLNSKHPSAVFELAKYTDEELYELLQVPDKGYSTRLHFLISLFPKDTFNYYLLQSMFSRKPPTWKGVEVFNTYWTPEDCSKCQDCLFIYEDTLARDTTMDSAIVRNCPNALGIPTSQSFGQSWSDERFDYARQSIQQSINVIMSNSTGKVLVFPPRAFGYGTSQLVHKAPLIYQYLYQMLYRNFGLEDHNGFFKLGDSIPAYANPDLYSFQE